MKKFLDENFLLENKTAQTLYHEYARDLPIIDYHCHLPSADLATNRFFNNITEAWLEGDHYKWRAMRTFGVDEKYITGDATPKEKFLQWSRVVPYTLRNPLYHWTHLELQRYFGIKDLLNIDSAQEIYDKTGEVLSDGSHGCMDLAVAMNVEVICTTDDPVDSLEYHQDLVAANSQIKVLPTFRPDKAFSIADPANYCNYIQKLSERVGFSIDTYQDLINALANRVEYFHENGGRLADHGLEEFYITDEHDPEQVFQKVVAGKLPTAEERKSFQQSVLKEMSSLYHKYRWTQQFHLGALRNNNSRMYKALGPDTGFDSIGDYSHARGLSFFLDGLDRDNKLTKTIIYNLNPSDNEMVATMTGNFNDGSMAGKIQFGSGWWYLDQKDGMERQMNTLSNMGLISQFVGMLTDSRSFLSFPRHEYFRRILCNLFGKDIENGELPNDIKLVGEIITDISYRNAQKYFEFDKVPFQQLAS